MAKHTKVSWDIKKQEWDGANDMHAILADDGEFVGEACGITNAHLIRAAPDMLEALEAIVDKPSPDAWGKVHCAIAKAKGE